MKNRIKQRQRQNRSIRAMQNKKQNLEVGQRVYVDFFSSNRVETDGTRISGFGVLDRVEPDGFVCGRLDIGQPFGCPSQYVQPQGERLMKPGKFIRNWGLPEAKRIIDESPDWAKSYYEPTGQYQDQEWSDEMSISLSDLKRLVESVDLVVEHYTVERAKIYANSPYTAPEVKDCLEQAIADYVSIYGDCHA
ncbi:TPA: hypothetical protein ACNIDW_001658 [Acinetobacter nosocomialis]